MSDYAAFLDRKFVTAPVVGLDGPFAFPARTKEFQRDIATWALRRGCAAICADTGLGKALMLLAWADNVQRITGGEILIFAPLAVAFQIVGEAEKFGIDGVSYVREEGEIQTRIAVTNYDRAEKFDLSRFAGVALDESGILRSVDGATRRDLTERCAIIPYRLCCTATPAPNDYTEIGQHAEFLGVMSAKEMLSMYFVHDGGIRAQGAANHGRPASEWRLKGHAERAFWSWVSSWMVMIRKPSDLGYSDEGYILPPLIRKQVTVSVEYVPDAFSGELFPSQANTLQERQGARRSSIDDRVAEAVKIIAADPDKPWLVWCGLNEEADKITAAVPGMVNVQGSDSTEYKEKMAMGFAKGSPQKLCSKVSIVGRGMNYQHCADMIFCGINDSFEQMYQATRRCWRFGQTKPVTVWVITSELEGAVVRNVEAKEADAERMAQAMAEHMKDLSARAIRGGRQASFSQPAEMKMELPTWLKSA